MRRALAFALVLIALALVAALTFLVTSHRAVASRQGSKLDRQDFTQIERGHYLTTLADCAGCHTLQGRDKPFAGGRPIETPFGSLASPNITPDRDTGIGSWSDDEFVAAIRSGKRPDGSLLYPAMPFPYYAKLTRDDALAIRAYLNTLRPIHNPVVADTLPFPFNIRLGLLAWDKLYYKKGEFKPEKNKSAERNRGAYLVEGPGHCGACHTPKTTLGGDETSRALQGYALQGWFAPNITNDGPRGLGAWSVDDIAGYLKSGHNAISAATGIMAEEIALSSSRLSDGDLKAIATYLKDQPGSTARPKPLDPALPVMKAGEAIYRDACSACHGPDGKGVPNLFPSLAASSNLRSVDAASLIRIVLEGARSLATPAEPTAPMMPAFSWRFNDAEVAAVLTYVRNSWGSAAPAVSEQVVKDARGKLAAKNY